MYSAPVQAAHRQAAFTSITMAEIDHPTGMGYFWSGLGDFDFGGNTYHGWGELVSVDVSVTTTEIEIVEYSFSLSGVDEDLLAGLDDSVKGRFADIYEAILDDEFRVIERELLTRCKLDFQVYSVAADAKAKATLVVKAHAGLFWLQNRSSAKWSPEEARVAYPDETGFDEMHKVEDQRDTWRPA